MDRKNPGLWIGVAVGLAVLIVGVSIPNRRGSADHSPPVPQKSPVEARAGAPGAASPSPLPASADATAPSNAGSRPTVEASAGARTPPTPGTVPDPGLIPQPATLAPPSPGAATRENAQVALDNLQFAFRDFRTALGGNPVGNNREITNALFGDNLKQVRQPMPDGSRINGSGELCDPWGTPYFFHQQSAKKMEIRSAGPDLQMWTSDDLQM